MKLSIQFNDVYLPAVFIVTFENERQMFLTSIGEVVSYLFAEYGYSISDTDMKRILNGEDVSLSFVSKFEDCAAASVASMPTYSQSFYNSQLAELI